MTIDVHSRSSKRIHSRGENAKVIGMSEEEIDKDIVELKERFSILRMMLEREDERQIWDLSRKGKLLVIYKDFKRKTPKFGKLGRNMRHLLSA